MWKAVGRRVGYTYLEVVHDLLVLLVHDGIHQTHIHLKANNGEEARGAA